MPKSDNHQNYDGIEKLRKKLYSRNGAQKMRRSQLHDGMSDVKSEWEHAEQNTEHKAPETLQTMATKKKKARRSVTSKILIGSIIFFVFTAGIATITLLSGSNTVSPDKVLISTSGAVSTRAGDPFSLQIEIKNDNNVQLEAVNLIVSYPEGTRSADENNASLDSVREAVGVIPPGETVGRSIEAVLFGERNDIKEIIISVEYRVAGSSATLYKDRSYEVSISESPLRVSIDAPEEISAGKEVEFIVNVESNSQTPLEDMLLAVEYPFGFTFLEANVEPSFDDTVWELGDIPALGKKTIRIIGTIEGQDNEERVFRFAVGTQDNRDSRTFSTIFISSTRSITVVRPFIGVALAINGNQISEEVSVRAGTEARIDVSWQNNLPTRVDDMEIVIELDGEAIDQRSISVQNGFYRSVDNTILWNKQTDESFSEINPGENGTVSFTLAPLRSGGNQQFTNPTITINAEISGRRTSESSSAELVSSNTTRTVSVASDLGLTARALYFSSPLQNSGPIPPRINQETVYTIVWSVTNSSSDVADAVVTAKLPSYVRWVNNISPSNENITFSAVGGEVTWRLGSVEAGTGFSSPIREVSFQLGITPSISQLNSSPIIIREATLSGQDTFTGLSVGNTAREFTTNINTDPQFSPGQGTVRE